MKKFFTFIAAVLSAGSMMADLVATPVISGSTEFTDSVIVTMSCATAEADIYYTIDGTTDPKCDCAAAPEYTEAIVIKETTTIKAAAYTGNDWSDVAEVTFTKVEAPVYDTLTCAAAAAAALAGDTSEVFVKGYVTNIAYAWKNGSMSFWMADSVKGGNVFEAYNCVVDSASAPEVTDLVLAFGKLTKYNTTPELAKGCTVEILEKGEGPEIIIIDVTNCATAAEAALSVSGNNVLYNDGAEYTVTGYVTSVATSWADGKMTFWMADAADGGNVLEAYKCAIANQADAPNVGDKVSVTGNLTKYNTTPEFAEGCTCVIVERGDAPKNLGEKTIAEFLDMKNRKDTCILHGVINNLPEDKSANAWKYGNFDLVDETGSLYIYGLLTPDGQKQQFASMGLENGSEISIKAIYTEYNGNPQAANAILIAEPKELVSLNVAEAVEIALALEDNQSTADNYCVYGYVAKVYEEYSSKFKNVSFYMTDEEGATFGDLQCRRAKVADADSALVAGDFVAIVGKLTNNYYQEKNTAQIYQGEASVLWKQAIENIIVNDPRVNKIIVDGVVYIVREGKIYNMQGIEVR